MEDLPEEDQHLQKLAEKRASKAGQKMEDIQKLIQSLFVCEMEITRRKELEKMLVSAGKLIKAYSTGQKVHAEKPNPTPTSEDETKNEMKALRQQMQRIEASLESLGERWGKKAAPVIPQKRSAGQTEESTTKSTYAEVAARGIAEKGNTEITQKGKIEVVIPVRKTVLTQKKADEVTEKNTTIHYKNRRLIIPVNPQKLEDFNPTAIRDQINDQFFIKMNMDEPVVTTITKSKSLQSMVVTTMPKFTAKWLQEKKEVWQNVLPCQKSTLDEKWTKLVIHTVPLGPFCSDEGLEMLKNDIQMYNGIKLMRNPVWLTSEEKKGTQKHGSILIHVENQEAAEKLLKFRMSVAGVPVKAEKFHDRTVQCSKCQKIGHQSKDCISAAKCRICANDHLTKMHKCEVCKATAECMHMPAKCANCLENHQANDAKCIYAKKPRRIGGQQNSPGNKMLLD